MSFRMVFCAIVLALPSIASAQFPLIQLVPGQSDDDFGTSSYTAVEAANGDVLVFVSKNGEITDPDFPPMGFPAKLNLYRTTDGGVTWTGPVVLDTAIDNVGVQGIGGPRVVVLPSGDILLSYAYVNDVFPNFSRSFKVSLSSDNGATWTALGDKPSSAFELTVTPGGMVISLDGLIDEVTQNTLLHTSTYDSGSDTWTDRGFALGTDNVCGQTIHANTETEWSLYFADCVFGFGGTNQVFRIVTTDGGATWGDPEPLFTADSGFGTLGSVVDTRNGLTAVYSSGEVVAFRTSADGGASWSEPEIFTGGDADTGDNGPRCSPSNLGPLCLFVGRRGTENQLVNIGVPGISGDPLLGAVAGFSINQGISGGWFDATTAGQGFLIDIDPDSRFMFVAWFTFDQAAAKVGAPGQRWLTAQGNFINDAAQLDLFESSGGAFGDPQSVTTSQVGTLSVTFADCLSGTIAYNLTSESLSGEIPIARLIPGTEALCAGVGKHLNKGGGRAIDQTLFGAWFDPTTPGQGFLFDIEPSSQFMFMAWFTFEAAGSGKVGVAEHRWLTAQGNYSGPSATLPVFDTSGGAFNNAQMPTTVEAGSVTVTIADCLNGLIDFTLTDGNLQGQIPITRVIPGTEELCEAVP